jgi:hypothetical protein
LQALIWLLGKKAKHSKDPHHDGSTTSEVKQQGCTCGVKTEKKKRKSSTGKVSKDEKNILKDVEKAEVSSPTLSLFLFCILDLCNRLKGYLFEVQTTPS